MNRGFFFLAVWAVCAGSVFAGTRMLAFIHQPLTTLGTAGDAEVVVTRVPVLVNMVPELIIGAIAWPNKLLQGDRAPVPDSNLVSLLHMGVAAELVSGQHFRITLDLRDMRACEPYGVTAAAVVAGTVQCLQATFDEEVNQGSYELRILPRKDDKSDWSSYEGRYEPKNQRPQQP